MKKFCFIIFVVACLIVSSCAFALEEYEVEHEFLPDEFVFEYNDHNTTSYEGDSGLKFAYVNNTLDNTTLIVPVERVRSVAYATRKSFRFDEPIIITHSIRRDDGRYILLTMKYKNGTVIPILDIDKDDLTNEQKTYFDDYYGQRQEYLMQQEQYAAENLYSYETYRSRGSGKSKYSYYVGSGGSGVIYTPGNDRFW